MPGSRSSSSRSFEHGKAVAGVNANDRRPLMQKRLDLGGEFLREIFELRAEAGLHALSGPDQLLAECA